MNSLQSALNNQNGDYVKNHDLFFKFYHEVLNKHEPRKKNFIRGNNKPLSWIRRYLKLSCKEHVTETNF